MPRPGRWFRPSLLGRLAEEVEDHDGEVEPNQPRKGCQSLAARAVESRRLHAIREALPQPTTGASPVPGWTPRFNPFRELASGSRLQNCFSTFQNPALAAPSAHSCRCGRLLDSLGHHQSAARFEQTLVQDLDLHVINNLDSEERSWPLTPLW